MLEAGFSRRDITPPLGSLMAGNFHPRYAEALADPLWVRALALRADGQPALVLTFDLISLGRASAQAIRTGISQRTGVPSAAINLAASHVHTGPATTRLLGVEADPGYLEVLAKEAVLAADQALASLAPHGVALGVGEARGIAFNRRFVMRSGPVRTNPGLRNPDIIKPAGPVDEQVIALLLEGTQRDLVLVNFSLHPDTVGGSQISADYPYWTAQTLARGWSGPLEMLFVNGAFGDINHLDIRADRPAPTSAIGERLGLAVLQALGHSVSLQVDRLGFAERQVTLKRRRLSPLELEQASRTAAEAPPDSYRTEHVYAREQVALAAKDPTLTARVSALALGEGLRYVFLPGEPFVELGLAIKRDLGPVTAVVGNADGTVGYVPTQKAYTEGGYEVTPACSSQLAPGSGEILVAEALQAAGAAM